MPGVATKKLQLSFYLRKDVVQIARELIGKILVTNWNGEETSGRIVETEAYEGEIDRASHASKGRTKRTEVIFGEGGKAYVYLCYGLHQMFNIITNKAATPHAILIRAVEPIDGIDIMLRRTGKKKIRSNIDKRTWKCRKGFWFSYFTLWSIIAKR